MKCNASGQLRDPHRLLQGNVKRMCLACYARRTLVYMERGKQGGGWYFPWHAPVARCPWKGSKG